jgi:hypothetical protein
MRNAREREKKMGALERLSETTALVAMQIVQQFGHGACVQMFLARQTISHFMQKQTPCVYTWGTLRCKLFLSPSMSTDCSGLATQYKDYFLLR